MSKLILDCEEDDFIKKRRKSLLDELDDLDVETRPLLSSYRPESEKLKDPVEVVEEANSRGDDWLDTIANFKQAPIARKRKSAESIFEYIGGEKKKKKKKKDKGEEKIDYAKEFEPELLITKNLLEQQNRFTDSLQRRYDILENGKSSARGIGKFTTDLIGQINQARGVSRQLVSDMVSLKKTVKDFEMKQKKSSEDFENGTDLNAYSANSLRRLLQVNRADLNLDNDLIPVEGDSDDIFASLTEELDDASRSSEVDKYIAYEKRGVKLYAEVDSDDHGKWNIVAIASDGEEIDDYPIPTIHTIEVNESTEIATDEFHRHYPIRWV